MGIFDTLLGKDAADASRRAAQDTFAKQTAAGDSLRSFGDTFQSRYDALGKQFGGLADRFQPWMATGAGANDAVRQLLANPESVRSLPGYQFGLDQGNRNITHAGAGTGSLFSGKTGKALERFGVGYADQQFGDHLARLLGVSQQGLDATGRNVATQGGGIGMQGQGLTGQLGTRTSAYAGDMSAADTIGKGEVAAANAETQGMQNLLNMVAGGAGMAMSAGGGGSGFSKLFGGSPSGPVRTGSATYGHMPFY